MLPESLVDHKMSVIVDCKRDRVRQLVVVGEEEAGKGAVWEAVGAPGGCRCPPPAAVRTCGTGHK